MEKTTSTEKDVNPVIESETQEDEAEEVNPETGMKDKTWEWDQTIMQWIDYVAAEHPEWLEQ